MKHGLRVLLCFGFLILTGNMALGATGTETMVDYTDIPISISSSVTPNILIIMDNSLSMNYQAFTNSYDSTQSYYGYFSNVSGCNYSYASNVFSLDNAGIWGGNFLNWATMREIDEARKVLVGGHATSRTGGGNQQLQGDAGGGIVQWKYGPTSATAGIPAAYIPPAGYKVAFELSGGSLNIRKYSSSQNPPGGGTLLASFSINVNKSQTFVNGSNVACDADSFTPDGNVAGLMQKIGTKARWGLEFFNNNGQGPLEGQHNGNDGGVVSDAITGPGYGTNFITDAQNTEATNYTPLAESLYTAAGYFSQSQMASYCVTGGAACNKYQNLDYNIGIGSTKDPMYFNELGQMVPCAKNFVIIITDGVPTMDINIPASIYNNFGYNNPPNTNYDGNNWYSSNYLPDVALWAHTTNLRPDLAPTSVVLNVYTVYAFGNDPLARSILQMAAQYGGFVDKNGNNLPDQQSEWASLGRTYTYGGVPTVVPDTYYEASDGGTLQNELMAAITDILKRAQSGTAVSVLATSATGAGYVYQAFFLPSKSVLDSLGARNLVWLGDLMQLNVDSTGSLRDKTNTCIQFNFDTASNQTVINNLTQTAGGNCTTTITSTTPLISFTGYNWNAGYTLLAKDPATRTIITFVDTNQNGVVDAGEQTAFTTANANTLMPYLNATTLTQSQNIISWIQGNSVTGYRDRTLSSAQPAQQWKLGDIFHSTPTVLGAPLEAYGLIYQDAGYTTYYNNYLTRQDVVYVGANDGMLHAFDNSGNELWAYIPYNVLPHLKWLTDPNYTHVDYVDMKVKVTDVNFGTYASPNWKTILIGGMKLGGGQITNVCCVAAGSSRNFISSYFAIDITNPTTPVVLWETNYSAVGTSMGYSMTYPCVVKVGDNFFAVVGSGTNNAYVPDYSGGVTQAGKIFVINIKTGAVATSFTVSDSKSYFADPIAVDVTLLTSKPLVGASGTSYGADAVYIGETYQASNGTWNSRMWRLVTNNDVNPAHWKLGMVFNDASGQPISAAPAATTDPSGNLWVFFGTGKYISTADKTDTNTQSVYGMKDPCWNPAATPLPAYDSTCLTASVSTPSVAMTNIVNVTGTNVYTTGVVSGGTTGATTFTGLQSLIASKSGWYFNLTSSTSTITEKSLNKPTIFGGLLMITSFVPTSDPCAMGGNSYIYALYYLTGTAYTTPAIGTGASNLSLSRTATSTPGLASSITIHSGRESGAKAFIQMSTGETITVATTPAMSIKSGIITWREL